MTRRKLRKRLLVGLLGGALALAVIVALSLQNPRLLTRVFFGPQADIIEANFARAFEPRQTDVKTAAITAAAKTFLGLLDEQQRQAASYAFGDNEQRANWSNFPEGMIPRGGLRLGELSDSQRAALRALLSELMSEKGLKNIDRQLAAEDTLPSNRLLDYGTRYFSVAFLGEPSVSKPWMFQFGGHHLAINATVYGRDVSFSPMLTGGQPLRIRRGGEDIFIVREETEAAQALLDSLTPEQKKAAVRGPKPIAMRLGPGKNKATIAPEGVAGGDLNQAQKLLLLAVIEARLGFINDDDKTAKMAAASAEIDDTYFVWRGPQGKLGFAYFSVLGPSLALEYSPQDIADSAETPQHAHSIYRDLQNDYGTTTVNASK